MQSEEFSTSDLIKAIALSFASRAIVHPLDRVRVIAETHSVVAKNRTLRDPLVMLENFYSSQGFWFFYRGIEMLAPRFAAQQLTTYFLKERVYTVFPPFHPRKQYLRFFLVTILQGVAWDALKSIILHPIDTVQTRLMVDTSPRYQGAMECIKQTYESGSFYSGIELDILSSFILRTSSFVLYEWFHLAEQESKPKSLATSLLVFSLTRLLSYPLEVARRQAMITGESGFKRLKVIQNEPEQLLEGALWHVVSASVGSLLLRAYDYFFENKRFVN